jgi:hypothetical protein
VHVSSPLTEFDYEVLSELERLELPTLTWGIVDSSLAEDEVLGAVESALEKAEDYTTSPREVLNRLEQHTLITPVPGRSDQFRTRFAETIRLLQRLRQLFPNHIRDRTWRAAPELVSDYRVLSRARRFPVRDVDPHDAIEEALSVEGLGRPDLAREVLNTLLGVRTQAERPLARFQAESLRHVLRIAGEDRPTATMISAGTGSGKTLAFYLPAFADVITHLDATHWTKVVAMYPRVELLKDQLSTAVGLAVRLRETLAANDLRPLKIGAFFGSTPYQAKGKLEIWGWKPLGRESHVCPFLVCWSCGGPTMWSAEDRTAGVEVLRCRDCGSQTEPGDLALTRNAMSDEPPDVLFTTTEMINRHLSSGRYGHIFGAHRRSRPPRIALLDEAHAYSGTTGAQTAFLLRRWQHAVGAPVHMVGLSATLEDAQAFLSRLTGIAESSVAHITPREDDLQDSGAEYLVALRGNPMSGTRLLSTTIQALMLLRRSEDLTLSQPTNGVFPPRVFAFCDDIDVLNRLYDYLLDAEGRSWSNIPRKDSLAALRSSGPPDLDERRQDGQVWDLADRIGHTLAGSTVSVTRTSSRDVGVDESSDIVVATASLEVGFDDIRVGSVLQHKAPKGTAAFVQRRGRAGRLPQARPWAVVVLSDFGRDRRAYQAFEELFEPALRPNPLPIDNRHVIKIQAAYALLDWLSLQMPDEANSMLWSDLSSPQDTSTPWGKEARRRQQRAVSLLRSVLADPREQERLTTYLRGALGVPADEVAAVLWEHPNALLLTVVPTLLRQLETSWMNVSPPPATDRHGRDPLPEFVPPNLFSELNTPEVTLTLAASRGEPWTESVPIGQALRELTPGRVTRRFSIEAYRHARHWNPLPSDGSSDVDIAGFLDEYTDVGVASLTEGEARTAVPCLRPWDARLEVPDRSIEDSQSGFLHWDSRLQRSREPVRVDLPTTNQWGALIADLEFFTHSTRTELSVLRFATGGEAGEPGHAEQTRTFRFVRRQGDVVEPVALGYSGTYDAIRVVLQLPDKWEFPEATQHALRRHYFDARVLNSPTLSPLANSFSRSWLAILYRSALTATSAAQHIAASEARDHLRDSNTAASLEKAMRVIFEVTASDPNANVADTRAERRLLALLHNSEVIDELHALGEILVGADPPPTDFIVSVFRTTFAAALKDAFVALVPRVDADSLIIDLPRAEDSGLRAGQTDIWLSEPSVGGGGVVEQLLAATAREPRRMLTLTATAIGESTYENVHAAIVAALELARDDPEVGAAFADYRASESSAEVRERFIALQTLLAQRGISWSRSAGATLATRVLRPGSSAATDGLILELHRRWDEIESLTGFDVDARVIAFALRNDLDVAGAIGLATPPSQEEAWRFSQIYGLIWPRGFEARTSMLDSYTPFASLPEPERLVIAPLLGASEARVDISLDDWRDELDSILLRDGSAVLVADGDADGEVKSVLLDILSRPTDLGFLHAYPRVVGVATSSQVNEISVMLDEAP